MAKDMGGFRELEANEIEVVSGGYYNEDPVPGGGELGTVFPNNNAALLASFGIYDNQDSNNVDGFGDGGGYDPDADYCGSGWSSGIVPDTVMGVDISVACYLHDLWYSDGTDKTRLEADKDFGALIAAILVAGGVDPLVAAGAAAVYFNGVRVGGGAHYEGPGAWNF